MYSKFQVNLTVDCYVQSTDKYSSCPKDRASIGVWQWFLYQSAMAVIKKDAVQSSINIL